MGSPRSVRRSGSTAPWSPPWPYRALRDGSGRVRVPASAPRPSAPPRGSPRPPRRSPPSADPVDQADRSVADGDDLDRQRGAGRGLVVDRLTHPTTGEGLAERGTG